MLAARATISPGEILDALGFEARQDLPCPVRDPPRQPGQPSDMAPVGRGLRALFYFVQEDYLVLHLEGSHTMKSASIYSCDSTVADLNSDSWFVNKGFCTSLRFLVSY